VRRRRRAACGGIHERGGAHERVGKQRLGEQPCLGSNQKVHYVRSSSVLLSFFVLYTYNNQQDGTAISNQQGVYGIMSI